MGILSKFKQAVKMTDFFYSSDMLRYENELEYRTLTGGILSLGIIITILIGFASMIIDTLNLQTINTSIQVIKQLEPTPLTLSTSHESMFMFGIEVWGYNLNVGPHNLSVVLYNQISLAGQTIDMIQIPLEPCTRQHWAKFPNLVSKFDQMAVQNWKCPQIGFNFDISGKYSSSYASSYLVSIGQCHNDTNSTSGNECTSQQIIDDFWLYPRKYYTFYYTNPVINPDKKEYMSYYLEDATYVIFGPNTGSQTFVYFADYTITTDYSIWPFQDIVNERGYIVRQDAVNHPFQTNSNDYYVLMYLAKSPESLVYNRQVQKISAVFSFIGGMIGALSAVLFVIKMYTSLSFQISIALQIFKPESNSQFDNETISMNFWTFVKYQIYQASKTIGKQLDWPLMEYVDDCQKQILRQLDIKALIKRLIFLEHCLTYIFQDYQLDGLQLKKPTSAKQIRKIRQKCESVVNTELDSAVDSSEVELQKIDTNEVLSGKSKTGSPMGLVNLNSRVYDQNSFPNSNAQPSVNKRRGFLRDDTHKVNEVMAVIDYIQKIEDKEGPQKTQPTNKVRNVSKNRYVRESMLSQLHKNANNGNEISKKIWQNLTKGAKDKMQLQIQQILS